jgi:hypothetical protein
MIPGVCNGSISTVGLGLDELVRHGGGLMRKSAQTEGQCEVGMTQYHGRLGS